VIKTTQTFVILDYNGNGSIDTEDIRRVVEDLTGNESLDPRQMDRIVEHVSSSIN
jgi:Ca2+-binding EF-hand superfamily protein